MLGRYHEAVVQVRGERVEHLMDIADRIADPSFVRKERLKYGWNIYFVHKAGARAVVQDINKVLKRTREKELEIIRSHKIAGKKDGNELWRDFYAIR
jgi:NMD protein affecting ribosome stability and mRNA decay